MLRYVSCYNRDRKNWENKPCINQIYNFDNQKRKEINLKKNSPKRSFSKKSSNIEHIKITLNIQLKLKTSKITTDRSLCTALS
jgi:hypothetical protein